MVVELLCLAEAMVYCEAAHSHIRCSQLSDDTHKLCRNPGGIRFGSSEIYEVLETCFSAGKAPEKQVILDSLVVGQSINGGADERVILFIVGSNTETNFNGNMVKHINAEIRNRRSPRHVPSKASFFSIVAHVITCSASLSTFPLALPDYTRSGHPIYAEWEES